MAKVSNPRPIKPPLGKPPILGQKIEKFESVAVPFLKVGNRRGLSAEQLVENPYLADFVRRFQSSFEHDVTGDFFLFIEPESAHLTNPRETDIG